MERREHAACGRQACHSDTVRVAEPVRLKKDWGLFMNIRGDELCERQPVEALSSGAPGQLTLC